MDYRKAYSTKETPQSEPIPGKKMAENNAGGFAFAVNDWVRLDRFLVLGSEGGTYYVGQRELTIQNAGAVKRCIDADGTRAVKRIVEISDSGRAPKNDPALFALAMCAGMGNDTTRKAALDALPAVARIGTHLFHFLNYVEGFRGWGRGLRKAVASWYTAMTPDRLAYQAVKYRQRDGWSHRDALRLSHPQSEIHDPVFKWITSGGAGDAIPEIIKGFDLIQNAEKPVEIIEKYNLPWEAVPTEHLKSPDVWRALLPKLPMTATLRNLGRLTSLGILKPMGVELKTVVDRFHNEEQVAKSRVHPLSVLVAMKTYAGGAGLRGSLSWDPSSHITDALDDLFYLSFKNVEPAGKRVMLAIDVSGSMDWNDIAGMPLTPRVAAGAMAMVTARVEPEYMITAFSDGMVPVNISPRQRLDDVISTLDAVRMGGTDCSLPILYALENKIQADAFVIYTDSETWYGQIHPIQALAKYRQSSGIPAKLIVVGMEANEFSIADPDDAGMMDVVGFDTATPNIMSDFMRA